MLYFYYCIGPSFLHMHQDGATVFDVIGQNIDVTW
jgi:hypothetical protein